MTKHALPVIFCVVACVSSAATAVRKIGGHITYHHDMFQTGYGTPAVPPNGIPDPEFSPYHRAVFEFIAQRDPPSRK